MSVRTKKELEEMMFNCVDAMYPYMTEGRGIDYGQNGYPVNELFDKVLGDIKREVNILILENKTLKGRLGDNDKSCAVERIESALNIKEGDV